MPRDREGDWTRDEGPAQRPASSKAVKTANLRKHLRFEVDGAGATLVLKGFLSFLGLGRGSKARSLLNLSEGGALLVANEQVSKGRKVRIRVEMEKYRDVFEADGVVRWCTRSRQRDREFHLGIQFGPMPPAQSRKLERLRDWFTSPEYRAISARRAKQSGSIEFFS